MLKDLDFQERNANLVDFLLAILGLYANSLAAACRCWMRPPCRTTSTSTSWIGLHIMSLPLGWAIAFTCGMHAAARWATMVILTVYGFCQLKTDRLQVCHCVGHQAMWFGGGWQCLFCGVGAAWHSPCCRDKSRQSSGYVTFLSWILLDDSFTIHQV